MARAPLRLRLAESTAANRLEPQHQSATGSSRLYPFTPRGPALDFTRRRRKEAPTRLCLSAAYQARIPRTYRMHILPVHPLDFGTYGSYAVSCSSSSRNGQLWLAPPRVMLSPIRATYIYGKGRVDSTKELSDVSDEVNICQSLNDDVFAPPVRKDHARTSSYASTQSSNSLTTTATDDSKDTCETSVDDFSGSPSHSATTRGSADCVAAAVDLGGSVAFPARCTRFRPRTTFAHVERAGVAGSYGEADDAAVPHTYTQAFAAHSPQCRDYSSPCPAADVTDVSLVRLQRILASPLYIDECYV